MALDSLYPNLRNWWLYNNDTGELYEGQFEPEDMKENVGGVWAEHFTLNRQTGILQWIHGSTRTLSFRGRLFARDWVQALDWDIEKIKSWAAVDDVLARPNVFSFWVGDGHLYVDKCIIENVTEITYGRPSFFGGLKDVSFTVAIREYTPYSLEGVAFFETRYHRAKEGDYYEWLTLSEYDDPLVGDIIRKRHPDKPNLQTGDVVKLPSFEAIRKDKVKQTSIPLETAFGRKVTPQRTLRLDIFDRRSESKLSHVVNW